MITRRRTDHSMPAQRESLKRDLERIAPHSAVADPTPEEIAAACARIRAQWTPTERARRRVVRCQAWTAPQVADQWFARGGSEAGSGG